MLKVKYKERPTKEAIEGYCRMIEGLLSVHKLKLEVDIWDGPMIIKSYQGNQHIEDAYVWIRGIAVKMPGRKVFSIYPAPRGGLDETVSDKEIWDDAYIIQDEIYQKLNRFSYVGNMSDPYWELWDNLPKAVKKLKGE
ncbi:MAG: hypothetical protein PHT88_00180 [Candidatus Moranbacteria bacterium]|nr:hypothetical protein [Candidatus Moranbacteria bacterium]